MLSSQVIFTLLHCVAGLCMDDPWSVPSSGARLRIKHSRKPRGGNPGGKPSSSRSSGLKLSRTVAVRGKYFKIRFNSSGNLTGKTAGLGQTAAPVWLQLIFSQQPSSVRHRATLQASISLCSGCVNPCRQPKVLKTKPKSVPGSGSSRKSDSINVQASAPAFFLSPDPERFPTGRLP